MRREDSANLNNLNNLFSRVGGFNCSFGLVNIYRNIRVDFPL
jgi:hypothetical protein